jgi:dipeptidyl aminopeptidase/acylaminoacyl peptidase
VRSAAHLARAARQPRKTTWKGNARRRSAAPIGAAPLDRETLFRVKKPMHPPRYPLGLIGLAACSAPGLPAAQHDSPAIEVDAPDFEDVLNLASVGSPAVSPDGRSVAYTRSAPDWDANRFETEIWLAGAQGEPFQLTRTPEGNSSSPEWSPDGRYVAFLADRGAGSQLHLIRADGGEAFALTGLEDGGIERFEWSPDGASIALVLNEPESKDHKARAKRYGGFKIEDAEVRRSHLWVLDVQLAIEADGKVERPDEEADDEPDDDERDAADEEPGTPPALRRLTGGDAFTVGGIAWSPDGTRIAFDHQPDPLVASWPLADLSVLDVATGAVTLLVDTPGPDSEPVWSPDGAWILFDTRNGRTAWYLNNELARVPAAGGAVEILTAAFDESPDALAWAPDGIYFSAGIKTERGLFRLDPESRAIRRVDGLPPMIGRTSVSPDGRHFAFTAESPDTRAEVWRWSPGTAAERVTDLTAQVAGWRLGSREVIAWTSRDGAEIEGVLFKPADFDPAVKHPLLVVIHGGPTGTSTPSLVPRSVYPVVQWLAKGALVLMPNYRGSAGYGEAFRSLNVKNLGVGDAWDVLSGVDHLIAQGFVDEQRMGAMGWSQGGYISAFLTTTSDRFAATSVGAGISNWTTYYANTDIHPFTRYYLGATPWEDPEVYAKTSPMTYINDARTPTLIQHGEFDKRVPIPNAYELFQGLEDRGVDVRLIVYDGFGHGINKPKEQLAAMWHNWQWFAKYVWGEEVELPLEAEEADE